MKELLKKIKVVVVVLAVVVSGFVAVPVMAGKVGGINNGIGAAGGNEHADDDLTSVIQTIINVILYIVGILAVAFIIYGGVKYATSAGDTAKVTSAKNTLMYAVIGLIIAILAFAIVNFVVDNTVAG